MKYYVPVGAGGVFFRIGMVLTGMMGSVVYWRASRRRAAKRQMERDLAVGHHRLVLRRHQTLSGITAGLGTGRQSAGDFTSNAGIDR